MRKILGIMCAILAATPSMVFAATLQMSPSSTEIHAGDTFSISVSLDTGADVINAFDGTLLVPENLVVTDIRFTGSIVPLWLTQPAVSSGAIPFAGVIPGGYQGAAPRNLFTVILKAQGSGSAHISFSSGTAVYRDDGKGTVAKLSAPSVSLSILPTSGTVHSVTIPADTKPPEPFTPRIVDGTPFNYAGKVLVFATQDKDSGVVRYEIARTYNPGGPVDAPWTIIHSPYQIPASDADAYLFVRATDVAGNVRMARVEPQMISLRSFVYRFAPGILFLLALLVVLIVRRFLHLRKK